MRIICIGILFFRFPTIALTLLLVVNSDISDPKEMKMVKTKLGADLQASIQKEANNLYVDTIFDTKSHFNAATLFRWIHNWIYALTSITSAIVATQLTGWAMWVSIASTILSSVALFVKFEELSAVHKKAGDTLNNISKKFRFLATTEVKALSIDDSINNLNTLREEKQAIDMKSLQVPPYAYKKAKKGIEENGEDDYFNEITKQRK
jgi:hypothetical protein